ncbi:hypothetical protein ACQUZK_09640, partial [Streptococcus pyogenes]|uniref:hypothetical protein n=1 Tax=Streptococcus pyogenes TaxID=1314 RepID=UPI003DA0635C
QREVPGEHRRRLRPPLGGQGRVAAVERLGAWGVARVHEVPAAADLLPPERGAALAAVVEGTGAATVLLASTFENKETAARLALATGAGLMVDASAVEAGPDGVVAVQQ